MEQSPSWEANRFWATQEIPHILQNPKVHYHSHKCLPPVPVLSQLYSILLWMLLDGQEKHVMHDYKHSCIKDD